MAIDETLIGAIHLRSGAAPPASERGSGTERARGLFRVSTLRAMLDGAYDGDLSFAELARHGDFGIGTLNGCDGEMIALDGEFLRADVAGRISPVPPDAKTPFAVVTFFDPEASFELARPGLTPGEFALDEAQAAIDDRVGHPELVHAVRLEGRFASVRCRSVPKQEPPYRPLAEIVAEQSVFDLEAVEGTLVGFRWPDLGLGLGVPGYHLHFLSADRTRGGHLLDARIATATVAVEDLGEVFVETPPGIELGGRVEAEAVDRLERDR